MGVVHLVLGLGLLVPLGRALTLPEEGEAVSSDPVDSLARVFWKYKFICVGIHLKPSILLTTGACVYDRNPLDMHVILQIQDYKKTEVLTIVLHPKFSFGNRDYNLALLILNIATRWDMYLFHLPRAHHSPGELIGMESSTYINYLEDELELKTPEYDFLTANVSVSLDYENDCGVEYSREWYCVKANFTGDFTWQVGYPLFIYTKNTKRCLGIYTGHTMNKSEENQLFFDIYSSYHWIDDYYQYKYIL